MLATENLDGATIERASAPVAREHAAARQVRPALPTGFEGAVVCAAALQRLCDSGHHGLGTSSRSFWLSTGFHPAGYGVLRLIGGGPDRPETHRRLESGFIPGFCLLPGLGLGLSDIRLGPGLTLLFLSRSVAAAG